MNKIKVISYVTSMVVIAGATFFLAYRPWEGTREKAYAQQESNQKLEQHQLDESGEGSKWYAAPPANQILEEWKPKNGEVMPQSEAVERYYTLIDSGSEESTLMGIDGIQAPNPFGERFVNRATVEDSDAQRYILGMARDRNEITKQRVDWLLYAVSINKQGAKHNDVYKEILKRWQNEDFSQLESDKQKILNLQK